MKKQGKHRLLALLLAVTMIFSGTTGVFAEEGKAVYEEETITGQTDAECTCGATGDKHAVNCPKYVAPETRICTCTTKCTDEDPNVWCDVCGYSGAFGCTGSETTTSTETEDEDMSDEEEEFWNTFFSLNWTDNDGNAITMVPYDSEVMPLANVDDTGEVVTGSVTVNDYGFKSPYAHFGKVMFIMSVNGEDSFCIQPWYTASGSYKASEAATSAASGHEEALGQILANYAASSKTKADYIATQVLVWEEMYKGNDYYGHMISGASATASFDSDYDTGHIIQGDNTRCVNPSASERIAAYNKLKAASATASGIVTWTGVDKDDQQAMITLISSEVKPGEKDPPDTPTTPEAGRGYGTITITKKDNNGKSLDGAIFSVKAEFASGKTSTYQVEVTDGTATLRFDFPEGDTDAATVTVTETKAPTGYVLDGTPIEQI